MVSVLRSPVAVRCGSDHRTTICYQNHNILGNECVTSTTSAETRQTARAAEVAVEGGGSTCGAARASGRAAQRRRGARNIRERMLRVKHPTHHRDDPYPPRVLRPRPPRWGAVAQRRRGRRAGRVPAAPLRAPPCAEKSDFWQPELPVSRCEKFRPGVSPPEIATTASCDGKAGEKTTKSRISPHMGRRRRDGADAYDRRTDRKRVRRT